MTPTQAAAERLDINELERVGNTATPPPWDSVADAEYKERAFVVFREKRNGFYPTVFDADRTARSEDADFVSFARNHWPAIIAALREGERLREEVKTMRALISLNGKRLVGEHWLSVVIERIAAGEDEVAVLEDYGWKREAGSKP